MHIAQTYINVKKLRNPNAEQDADYGGYADLGSKLKDLREKRNLSLDQVSKRLNIRGHYIKALEEGRVTAIPGQIYVDGYLRNYADYLGMDGDMMAASYRGSGGRSSNDDNFMLPEISNDEMRPGKNILLIALLLLLVIYGIWHVSNRHDVSTSDEAAEATPMPTNTEKALDARVVILAKNDVEVTVLGADGATLANKLLHSGDTYFVPSDGLILKTSVPENIQLFVDGEAVSPYGKSVMTEAGILLDPKKLLDNSGFKDSDHDTE
jgi:cytoskeletal protein RodZ